MTDKVNGRVATVAVIGGGPAGLMAAETMREQGLQVEVFDGMPSVGRKFLLAGVGGMNITHSEATETFLSRYGTRRSELQPLLDDFGADDLVAWVNGLGIETFVGSSGRVFPKQMKAAPLLRAWLHRLRAAGVRIHARHRWLGWNADGSLRIQNPDGEQRVEADAVVLALGGGSWSRLGSDGAWVPLLQARGIPVVPLKPSNCGFDVAWSSFFSARFAGEPMKNVAIDFSDSAGLSVRRTGEFVITQGGVEGSLIYSVAAPLRDEIERAGSATLHLDLLPQLDLERVTREVAHPRGSRSMSSHLQSRLGIKGVKSALLHEVLSKDALADPQRLARGIKSLPIRLLAPRPLDEAISSAGGVPFECLDERLMLRALPGVFCAGEMLDWEAPTGGYLLTACFAGGRRAGRGVVEWLSANA